MKVSDHARARENLFSVPSSKPEDVNKESGKLDRTQQLLHARNEMQIEFEKLRSTADVIESSSKTIGIVSDKYSVYRAKLASASMALKSLKNKMENDDKYIYYSFTFFLVVAGYICVRRLGLVAVTQWLLVKLYTVIWWLQSLYGQLFNSTELVTTTAVVVTTQHHVESTTVLPTPLASTFDELITTEQPPSILDEL